MDETTTVLIDDVLLMEAGAGARTAVTSLDFDRFKDNIRVLSDFGDRTQGAPSNIAAGQWLETQLKAAGYAVQRHRFTYNNQPRDSIYVTKVGTRFPDQMYIVSAHMDGRGGGGAANDDARAARCCSKPRGRSPGCRRPSRALHLLEQRGERAQRQHRLRESARPLQGMRARSARASYPEPSWLGMIQHDQILFDQACPAAEPDSQRRHRCRVPGVLDVRGAIAAARHGGPHRRRPTRSAIRPRSARNINYTDSVPFQNYTATVSVRDNQRVAEIGNCPHPHWHQPTDLYATFSEHDFQLGFNAVQMTLGTVAELAGTTLP